MSTAGDVMRFCLMLSQRGALAGARLLTLKSVELMTRNHLPDHLIPLDKKPEVRYAGLGFGLGVSVRVHRTDWISASQVGEDGWIGGTSTEFWILPRDELVTIDLAEKFHMTSEIIKTIVSAHFVYRVFS